MTALGQTAAPKLATAWSWGYEPVNSLLVLIFVERSELAFLLFLRFATPHSCHWV